MTNPLQRYKTILNAQRWPSSFDLIKFLEKTGHEEVECGSFASVLHRRDEDVVIKVTAENDWCWYNFAKWSTKQKINHLPRFYCLKKYKTNTGPFYVACMEKLKSIEDELDDGINNIGRLKDLRKMGFILWAELEEWHNDFDSMMVNQNIRRSLGHSSIRKWPQFKGLTCDQITKKIISNFKKTALFQTIKKVDANFCIPGGGCFRDYHTGNIMQRKDGTLVLTDPVATGCSYTNSCYTE